MHDAKLKLTTLREYRTGDGRPYLRGYLGDAKVLLFRDDKAERTHGAEAMWNVFLEASQPRGAKPDATAPTTYRRAPRASVRTTKRAPAPAGPFLDDPLDDVLPLTSDSVPPP